MRKANNNKFLPTLFEYGIFYENCSADAFKSFAKVTSQIKRKK